jgi:hypothetical protein
MSNRVNRLIHTSADDCRASMPYEKSMKVLNAALKKANELGYKTKAKHIAKRISELRGKQ